MGTGLCFLGIFEEELEIADNTINNHSNAYNNNCYLVFYGVQGSFNMNCQFFRLIR